MVDPTWKTTCPACGAKVDENQMGQVYGHKGVTGCPYSGTGSLQRQHIYPLKFDYRPVITATAAYMDDGLAATIRYGLESEKRPAAGEYISMRTADGDVFGIAKAGTVEDATLRHAFRQVRNSKARYSFDRSSDLKEAMNGYYDTDIDYDTEMTHILYRPHIPGVYRDKPPANDRL